MKRSKLAAILVLVLLAGAGVGLWWWKQPRAAKIVLASIVSGSSYNGIIVPSREGGNWMPSEQDIAALEQDLAQATTANPKFKDTSLARETSQFWRHYYGFSQNGRRVINIRFLRKGIFSENDWLTPVRTPGLTVMVSDAGETIWNVTYDVKTRAFESVSHKPGF